jgi:hypothetical protein
LVIACAPAADNFWVFLFPLAARLVRSLAPDGLFLTKKRRDRIKGRFFFQNKKGGRLDVTPKSAGALLSNMPCPGRGA